MTYAEQLRHPSWQRKRLEVLEAADFQCEECNSKDRTLHAHHRFYVKGEKAWEYALEDLQCLCESCHQQHHEQRAVVDRFLGSMDMGTAMALLGGYCNRNDTLPAELFNMAERESFDIFAVGWLAAIAATLPMSEVQKLTDQAFEALKKKKNKFREMINA